MENLYGPLTSVQFEMNSVILAAGCSPVGPSY